ncbi:hypothetical protein [Magnetovibrio sp.]|uniref:hypothetical protein n=1 Tax=Magnetovibrio sp. TaxID=2024836 RepID=UPI002F942274
MTDSTENTENTSDADEPTQDAATPTSSTALTATSGGVNAQIIDAVNQTNAAVMSNAANQGAATAYQKVAQAAAFSVQDATDYSRNIENIAMTAQGVIVTKMLENEANIPIYTPVLATLQEMVIAASTNLATVGATATTIATEFPATKT